MLTSPETGVFGQEGALFSSAGMEFTASLLSKHPGLVFDKKIGLSNCAPHPTLDSRQHNLLRGVLDSARSKAKDNKANYAAFLSQVETDAFCFQGQITGDAEEKVKAIDDQITQKVGVKNVYLVDNFLRRFLVDVTVGSNSSPVQEARVRLTHYILDDLAVVHDASQLSTSERLKYLADYLLNRLRIGSVPLGLDVNRQQVLTQTAENLLNLLGGVDKNQAPTTLLPEKSLAPPLPKEIGGGGGFASRLEPQVLSNGPLWTDGWDYAYKILHVDTLFSLVWAREFYGDVKKTKGGLIAGPREWLGVYGALVREMKVNHTPGLSAAKVRLLTLAHIISSVGGLQSWQNIGASVGYNEVLVLCDRAIRILKLEWGALDNMKPRKGGSINEAVLKTIYRESANVYFSPQRREELIYKRYGVLFKGLGLTGDDLKTAGEISQGVL